jgi:hypothetical protein
MSVARTGVCVGCGLGVKASLADEVPACGSADAVGGALAVEASVAVGGISVRVAVASETAVGVPAGVPAMPRQAANRLAMVPRARPTNVRRDTRCSVTCAFSRAVTGSLFNRVFLHLSDLCVLVIKLPVFRF